MMPHGGQVGLLALFPLPFFPFFFLPPTINTDGSAGMGCQKLSFSDDRISHNSARKASTPQLIIMSPFVTNPPPQKKPRSLASLITSVTSRVLLTGQPGKVGRSGGRWGASLLYVYANRKQ